MTEETAARITLIRRSPITEIGQTPVATGSRSTVLAGAKRHRLEPWAYLTHVLLHLSGESADVESLLPDRWAAAHPKHVLAHRLDESRQRQARQQRRRAERRRASV